MKTVSDIMSADIVFLSPDDNLQYAAQQMCDINVGIMPVVEGGTLIGVITDRDICCRAVAPGRNTTQTSVRSIMSKDVVTCGPGAQVREAVDLMSEHQIRRLMIVDDKRRLVGVVAQADVATEPGLQQATEELVGRISH